MARLTDYVAVDVEVRGGGEGGFGLVFFGPNARNGGRWAALKTLRPELLEKSPRLRELFLREALTWVGLWPHANVLIAQGANQINGQLFLRLAYAEGGDLRPYLTRPDIPFGLRLTWGQMVAAGLAYLHAPEPARLRPEPLVHRDLKPENVLVMESGFVVITDFGLAKAVQVAVSGPEAGGADGQGGVAGGGLGTEDGEGLALLAELDQVAARREAEAEGGETAGGARVRVREATRSRGYRTARGAAMGTLAYMAPEQWDDAASAGPPADVYAFGLLLGELLSGRHPLLPLDESYTEAAWRHAHFAETPRTLAELAAEGAALGVAPELPTGLTDGAGWAELEATYRACLAKQAEDRPSAVAAYQALRRAATALDEEPYDVPEVVPHTHQNERTFWHSWAVTCLNFGRYEEALARSEQELAVDPDYPFTLETYGTILMQLGRYEEAEAAFKAALAAYPRRLPDLMDASGVAWNLLATLYSEHMARYQEADEAHAHAIALNPENATWWFNRGNNEVRWVVAEQEAGASPAVVREHLERGLAYAERAYALNPADPGYIRLRDILARLPTRDPDDSH